MPYLTFRVGCWLDERFKVKRLDTGCCDCCHCPSGHCWGWLAVGLLAYGAAIEIAQGTLTTDRDASWADWIADALGLALGHQVASHMNTAGNLSGSSPRRQRGDRRACSPGCITRIDTSQ